MNIRGKTKRCGKRLDFALAFISALRSKHDLRHAMSIREIAFLTNVICEAAGFTRGGCTWQNIFRIEKVALRKLRGKLGEQYWNYRNAK